MNQKSYLRHCTAITAFLVLLSLLSQNLTTPSLPAVAMMFPAMSSARSRHVTLVCTFSNTPSGSRDRFEASTKRTESSDERMASEEGGAVRGPFGRIL